MHGGFEDYRPRFFIGFSCFQIASIYKGKLRGIAAVHRSQVKDWLTFSSSVETGRRQNLENQLKDSMNESISLLERR